jgi:uncharacterized protein (UPF0276 family)
VTSEEQTFTRFSSAPIPARAGVGLKPEHYRDILEGRPDIGWFEVHPENYMGAGGPPHHFLERVRQDYPLSLHGVGLSIGAARPLDVQHMSRLKALLDRYDPGMFSEHLAWSTHEEFFLNDLLPLPYTHETLAHVAGHVDAVQTALGRRMLIENPSTYVRFDDNDMDEIAFLTELVKRTGCGLLLDVNNVYVSAANHGYDAAAYIDAFPVEHVGEIHLAGHAETQGDAGERVLIDAHDRSVLGEVWELYRRAVQRSGPVPTLIEWDNDIPAWPVLFEEARRAERIMTDRRSNHVTH